MRKFGYIFGYIWKQSNKSDMYTLLLKCAENYAVIWVNTPRHKTTQCAVNSCQKDWYARAKGSEQNTEISIFI